MRELKNNILTLLSIFTFAFCAILYENSNSNEVSAAEISICPGNSVQCTVTFGGIVYNSERGKNDGDMVLKPNSN